MIQELFDGGSGFWLARQTKLNQMLGLLIKTFFKFNFFLNDIFIDFKYTLAAKWWIPMKHFVQQYSQTPDVYWTVVFLIFIYLRSHVFICTTKCPSLFSFTDLSTPAEVTYLRLEVGIQQNILRFQVTMDYSYLVNSKNSFANLFIHIPNLRNRQWFLKFSEIIEQVSNFSKF